MRNDQEGFLISRGLVPYALTALLIAAADLVFSLLLHLDESVIRIGMTAGVVCCAVAVCMASRKSSASSRETILLFIILAGIILRIGYMLYTPYDVREHDVNGLDSTGHADYVYLLFSSATLPQTNEFQFYQPPFAHIAMALVAKIFSLFLPNAEFSVLMKAAQIVPCFATCAMLFITRSLCREMELSPRATALTLAVVAVHPVFYMLSSSVNNDALAVFLYMTAVLYTIRWYRDPRMKHILSLALAIGLGMMTKMSALSVALFTAPVFLIMLIRRWKERRVWPLIGQFAAFGAVSLPLGLWYAVRNYIKFHQMPNYVFRIPKGSDLYCGYMSATERFFSFPFRQLLNPLYCNSLTDGNVWLYLVKSSVFGEYTFDRPAAQAKLLILANFLLILLSLAAMIYILIRGKGIHFFARFGLFGLWIIQLASFIAFNIQYAYGCTMDFRYIVPTAIIGAIYLAVSLDRLRNEKSRLSAALTYLCFAAIALFGVASVAFYA